MTKYIQNDNSQPSVTENPTAAVEEKDFLPPFLPDAALEYQSGEDVISYRHEMNRQVDALKAELTAIKAEMEALKETASLDKQTIRSLREQLEAHTQKELLQSQEEKESIHDETNDWKKRWGVGRGQIGIIPSSYLGDLYTAQEKLNFFQSTVSPDKIVLPNKKTVEVSSLEVPIENNPHNSSAAELSRKRNKILSALPQHNNTNPIAALGNFCRHQLKLQLDFNYLELPVGPNPSEPVFVWYVSLNNHLLSITWGFRKKYAKEIAAKLALIEFNYANAITEHFNVYIREHNNLISFFRDDDKPLGEDKDRYFYKVNQHMKNNPEIYALHDKSQTAKIIHALEQMDFPPSLKNAITQTVQNGMLLRDHLWCKIIETYEMNIDSLNKRPVNAHAFFNNHETGNPLDFEEAKVSVPSKNPKPENQPNTLRRGFGE